MSAQQQWLKQFTDGDYVSLSKKVKAPTGQAFLSMYHKEDIYQCYFDGTSGSTWDISPPNIERLHNELTSNHNVSIYVTVAFTREPSPGLSTETVTGLYVRTLNRNITADNETMHAVANMLQGISESQNVTISKLFPHFWTVPASGKAEPSYALKIPEFYGTVSLELKVNTSRNAMWWTVGDVANDASSVQKYLWMTTFNQRIAPSSVLSMATNYGVIGLYVSLVLVVGRFVRMWLQGLSFRIMFVELPTPDFLLKLCLDIYLVRECGELKVEEDLFSQLLFLYRSPETLIKVTKQKVD